MRIQAQSRAHIHIHTNNTLAHMHTKKESILHVP